MMLPQCSGLVSLSNQRVALLSAAHWFSAFSGWDGADNMLDICSEARCPSLPLAILTTLCRFFDKTYPLPQSFKLSSWLSVILQTAGNTLLIQGQRYLELYLCLVYLYLVYLPAEC